jgi:hypothetical protein
MYTILDKIRYFLYGKYLLASTDICQWGRTHKLKTKLKKLATTNGLAYCAAAALMSSDKGSFLEWPEGDGLLVVVVPRAAQLPGLFDKSLLSFFRQRYLQSNSSMIEFYHLAKVAALFVKFPNGSAHLCVILTREY